MYTSRGKFEVHFELNKASPCQPILREMENPAINLQDLASINHCHNVSTLKTVS